MGNTIILVRHGESNYNQQKIIQGNTDYATLNAKGKDQAASIGIWLKTLKIDYFHSSPLKRALLTSEIISKNSNWTDIEINTDPRLEEADFKGWKGRNRIELANEETLKYKNWRKKPFDLEIDGFYPIKDLYSRIKSFLEEKILKKKNSIHVIVAHKGTILAITNLLLKLPRSHHHFLQIDRGSVTVIQERKNDGVTNGFQLSFANENPSSKNKNVVDFETEERTYSHGELFLVRHGQTASNIKRKYQGSKDIPLSPLGKEKVLQLATLFLARKPMRIICSPLVRAKESALLIARTNNIDSITIREDIHELLYGIWEGMTEEDVKKFRYSEYTAWQSSPEKASIPKAEHINNAYLRCSNVWDDYQEDIKTWGGSIISVAHDIVNRLIICNALDLPANYIWSFKQTNASVSVLAIKSILDGRLRMLNHSINSIQSRLSDEYL